MVLDICAFNSRDQYCVFYFRNAHGAIPVLWQRVFSRTASGYFVLLCLCPLSWVFKRTNISRACCDLTKDEKIANQGMGGCYNFRCNCRYHYPMVVAGSI